MGGGFEDLRERPDGVPVPGVSTGRADDEGEATMTMTMTEGEQMVWAATYARMRADWMAHPMPDSCVHDAKAREEYESLGTHNAIEGACYAVLALREALPGIAEGYDPDSDVYRMAAEMVG